MMLDRRGQVSQSCQKQSLALISLVMCFGVSQCPGFNESGHKYCVGLELIADVGSNFAECCCL